MTAPSLSQRTLNRIETLGNRLPHPTLLFVWLCGIVLVLSAIAALLGVESRHPVSGEVIGAVNLISAEGLRLMLERTVTNFTQFAPLGTVLVAMLGIGIAEHSGLIGTLLRVSILKAPEKLLTFLVVFAGAMSSIAADAGYVVLIPLAAIIFHSAGRSPIAGIAAAFAGVSGGFSANLLIGPLDAILAGLSTEAAGLVDISYTVTPAANYYFIVVSTLLVAVVGTLVTEKIIMPRFPSDDVSREEPAPLSLNERRGLRWVGVLTLVFTLLLLAGLIPEQGVLRGQSLDGSPGSVLDSPFINGIVTIIALFAAIAGWLFGRISGRYSGGSDVVQAMESSMATMAGYLVLMFFAAQFVNYFAWSQLGIISAIEGAAVLKAINPHPALLLVCFVLFAALINLVVGSASAKWALFGPIFVPMLMLAGIAPEATQVAYRIGDSATNIITPLMPYFGVVLAFAQKYDREIGIGTIIATMLPYTLWLLVSWSLLLTGWILLDLPLGPGGRIFMP